MDDEPLLTECESDLVSENVKWSDGEIATGIVSGALGIDLSLVLFLPLCLL